MLSDVCFLPFCNTEGFQALVVKGLVEFIEGLALFAHPHDMEICQEISFASGFNHIEKDVLCVWRFARHFVKLNPEDFTNMNSCSWLVCRLSGLSSLDGPLRE